MSTKRILASGVFDILHPGHLYYLREARKLGGHLTVVVTSDTHATRSKRPPTHNQQQRSELVGALEMVDEVIIGAEPYDLAATTRQADPDIIALGHDQDFDPTELQRELAGHRIVVEVVRIPEHRHSEQRTRDILREL